MALSLLAVPLACSVKDRLPVENKPMRQAVQLALSLHGKASDTKADVSVLTELKDSPQFRGVTDILFLPFSVIAEATEEAPDPAPVKGTDETFYYTLRLSSILGGSLVQGNNAHLFTDSELAFYVPQKMASALVYGAAFRPSRNSEIEEQEYKHQHGSLLTEGFSFTEGHYLASRIRFNPDAMIPANSPTPSAAATIASVLTKVVMGDQNHGPVSLEAYYDSDYKPITVTLPWDDNIGDVNLRACYRNMVSGGTLMSGSGTNVAALLSSLYNTLYDYSPSLSVGNRPYEVEKSGMIYEVKLLDSSTSTYSTLTYAYLYNKVREEIMKRMEDLAIENDENAILQIAESSGGTSSYTISFKDPAVASYPENLGLPSGAAAVRWTPTAYVVPLDGGLDGIAALTSYCYPPAIYYYTNTTIKTAHEEVDVDKLSATNVDTWPKVLNKYYTGETVVTSSTRSVALKDPLQYGVGLLSATVKAGSSTLQDNDGVDYTVVDVTTSSFPLTGIIIGRQYPQRFNFTPVYSSNEETADQEQYYLYDNQLSGSYLKTYAPGTTPPVFRTPVLQTPSQKDVYVCLEFQNNSEKEFYGAEGRILPGHKFYLVGKLPVLPAEKRPDDMKEIDYVFMQDRITNANFVISSLKNAHSAIPDMGVPQLTLGVQVEVNWKLTATNVPLE